MVALFRLYVVSEYVLRTPWAGHSSSTKCRTVLAAVRDVLVRGRGDTILERSLMFLLFTEVKVVFDITSNDQIIADKRHGSVKVIGEYYLAFMEGNILLLSLHLDRLINSI